MLNKKQKLWILAVLGTLVLTIGLAFLSQKTALFKGLTKFEIPTPDYAGIAAATNCESKTTYAACIIAGGCTWNIITGRCTVSQPLPDLSADTTDPTVNFVSPTPAAGTISGTVTIKVDATDSSGIEDVRFFIDNIKEKTDLSAPYEYIWHTIYTPNGSHTLKVIARDESENTRDITRTYTVQNAAVPEISAAPEGGGPLLLDLPDLEAQNLSWTPNQNVTAGTPITLSADVKNTGTANASNFSVHFCIDNPSCATTPVGRVGVSDSIHLGPLTLNQTWSTTSVPWIATEGAHEIQFCVDVTAGITEVSEENNCAASVGFSVGTAGGSPPQNNPPNKPTLLEPINSVVTTSLTPTLKWQDNGDPDHTAPDKRDYQWQIKDKNTATVVWERPWGMPSGETDNCEIELANNRWGCTEITVPSGKLQHGKTYLWEVEAGDGYLSSGYSTEAEFRTPAAPALTISASTPANQGTTLNPGIQIIKAMAIDLAKTGGDNAVDKISAITLNLSGDFPKTKLKDEELWVEGVKVNATITKNPTKDILTINLPADYLVGANKKFIFYVKAEVAEVDANRKFQYKVTGITTDPVGMTKTYSGGGTEAAGPEFTVAEAAEELTCANGKVEQGGACACPAGKNEFSGGITYYTPSVCIPCTTAQLISSGGFYCPQDKPAAPPPPPPPPPPGGSPPPSPPPETGLQACAAKGKYAYTGPPKPGVRTPGMCIDCSTELYIKLGGKCVEDKKTDDKKADPSTAGTGGTAGTTKIDSQTSGGQAGAATPGGAGGAGAAAAGAGAGAGTRGAAPIPGLEGSQRLVRAPERGQVGPGVAVYFGILAVVQGGIWLKRRFGK